MVEQRLAFILLILGSVGCTEPNWEKACAEGAGPSGTAGAGGEAGAPGAAGAPDDLETGSGGGADSGGGAPVAASVDDRYATNVAVEVHDHVQTLLVVTWEQALEADACFLEFEFEGKVMNSHPKPGGTGQHRDVVLGIPEKSDVKVRIVSRVGDDYFTSRDYEGTTGSLPTRLPRPEVHAYDPRRASPERWMLGSVEDSPGGRDFGYYTNTFWLYIMDRQGRIVWYYADPASNATSSFQRVAKDGEYLWIEKRPWFGREGERGVLKMTLDWEYFEPIPVPGLADCIDVTDDGSLLFDTGEELHEMNAEGEFRSIWSCRDYYGAYFNCYSNTVNYNSRDDTVLMSFPVENTVVEIDRQTGDLVAQYGNLPGSYGFAPPRETPPKRWSFSFQHFPNITAAGTLLLSSHMPGCDRLSTPVSYQHAFVEFDVDRENRRLSERWRYVGPEWPRAKGMAIRLANGNTLANYGTGGVIREITPDQRTVFYVKFDTPGGSDFYNKMVGNNVFIDDLYSLNGGPH